MRQALYAASHATLSPDNLSPYLLDIEWKLSRYKIVITNDSQESSI